MDKKRIGQIKEQFALVIHSDETANIEFWFARELMPLLGYERWENFAKAINRAMESCETSGIEVSDHFREVTKMIETKTIDFLLSVSHMTFGNGGKLYSIRYFNATVWRILASK